MLNHVVIGPRNGEYIVGYPTPGCEAITTVACVCKTPVQAAMERDRLNRGQERREEELQEERRLCGLWRIVDGR